jgi:hypothetical protein
MQLQASGRLTPRLGNAFFEDEDDDDDEDDAIRDSAITPRP